MTRQEAQREWTRAALDGRHASFFREVEAICALLLEDVHRRTRPEPMDRPRDSLRGKPLYLFLAVEILGWATAFWGIYGPSSSLWLTVAGVVIALVAVVLWSSLSVRQFRAE